MFSWLKSLRVTTKDELDLIAHLKMLGDRIHNLEVECYRSIAKVRDESGKDLKTRITLKGEVEHLKEEVKRSHEVKIHRI